VGRSLVERFRDPISVHPNKEEEQELSQQVTSALQASIIKSTFPKCVMDVHIRILQADGSLTSSMIIASSLALCDAGIECYDLVTACTVAIIQSPSTSTPSNPIYHCLVDPTEYEMMQSQGILTLAMLANARNDVTFWDVQGKLPYTILQQEALELAKYGCHTIHKFMRQCLMASQESS